MASSLERFDSTRTWILIWAATALFISATVSAQQQTPLIPCTSDSDCNAINIRVGSNNGQQGYLCSKGFCSFTVAPGEVCRKASDCAQYQFVTQRLQQNTSLPKIFGNTIPTNVTDYLDNLCAPQYCTIASFCSENSNDLLSTTFNPFNLPIYDANTACCAGGENSMMCVSNLAGSINTCESTFACQVSSNFSDNNFYCGYISQKSTQWIGVVISLIGASFLNIGLNLQKLALRKRHEKQQKKKLEIKLLEKLAALTRIKRNSSVSSRLSTLFRSASSRRSSMDALSSTNGVDESAPETGLSSSSAAAAANKRSRSGRDRLDLAIQLPREPTAVNISATSAISATVMRDDGTTEDIQVPVPEEDKAEYQKELDFKTLIKNPIWVLGFLVFIFSSFLNFIALQFAPQSLIAPLGSISLVVNVVMAPLINREKFTWKDIVGVVLIVGGSSMTVVFAGVSSQDFNLCVLLALFRKPATIGFLTVTAVLIATVFCTIVFIEKNLDLPDTNAPNAIGQIDGGAGPQINVSNTDVTSTKSDKPGATPRANDGSKRGAKKSRRGAKTPAAEDSDNPAVTDGDLPANRDSVLQWTSAMTSKVYLDMTRKNTARGPRRPRGTSSAVAPPSAQPMSPKSEDAMELTVVIPDEKPKAGIPPPTNQESSMETLASVDIGETQLPNNNNNNNNSNSHSNGAAVSPIDMSRASQDSAAPTNLSIGSQAAFLTVPTNNNSNVAPPMPPLPPTSPKAPHTPSISISTIIPHIQQTTSQDVDSDKESFVSSTHPESDKVGGGNLHHHHHNGAGGTTRSNAQQSSSHPSGRPLAIVANGDTILADGSQTNVGTEPKPTLLQRLYLILPKPMQDLWDKASKVKLVPRLKRKIPLDSQATRILLPFSYASLGGLMATITVLFAKSTIHLLTSSFTTGQNQFTNFSAWIITGVTVITAVNQIYWINMGLQRYDALLQIPVFYVVWTLFDVIGGGVYFGEFDGFSSRQYGLFFLAVGIIFLGVAVLGDRLKKSHV